MTEIAPGRWPPAYDAEDLERSITALVRGAGGTGFYSPATGRFVGVAQGDLLELPAKLPFLDEDAKPAAETEPTRFWMIVGNTCDLDRSYHEVEWTNLVPLRRVAGRAEVGCGSRGDRDDVLTRHVRRCQL